MTAIAALHIEHAPIAERVTDTCPPEVTRGHVERAESRNALACSRCEREIAAGAHVAIVPVPCCRNYRCGRGRVLRTWCLACLERAAEGRRYHVVEHPCEECSRPIRYVHMGLRQWWPVTCGPGCHDARRARQERARGVTRRTSRRRAATWRPCESCGASFTGRSAARSCSARCRQAAYRRRLAEQRASVAPAVVLA